MHVLPHIHRIPAETLVEIFDFGVDCSSRMSCPSPKEPQVLLSHVCRSWRNAILDMPRFWSHLQVGSSIYKDEKTYWNLDEDYDDDEGGGEEEYQSLSSQRRVLEEWIPRAKNIPLSFMITFENDSHWNAQEEEFIDFLTSFSLRWVYLDVRAPAPHLHRIIPFVANLAPLLSYLDMKKIPNAGIVEQAYTLSLPMPTSDRISGVKLDGVPSKFDRVYGYLHFANNLRTFLCTRVNNVCLGDVYFVLRQCPMLETLNMHVKEDFLFNSPRTNQWPTERLKLPHLEVLIIYNDTPFDVGPLLDCLQVRNLTSIEIHQFRQTSERERSEWDCLERMFDRSQPLLNSLALHGPIFSTDRLLNCLVHLESLILLELGREFVDEYMISRLLWKHGDTASCCDNILPKLQIIRLEVCFFPPRLKEGLAHLVQSRCALVREMLQSPPASSQNTSTVDFSDTQQVPRKSSNDKKAVWCMPDAIGPGYYSQDTTHALKLVSSLQSLVIVDRWRRPGEGSETLWRYFQTLVIDDYIVSQYRAWGIIEILVIDKDCDVVRYGIPGQPPIVVSYSS